MDGQKLLFFARRSSIGIPGTLAVLRSLTTWLLAHSTGSNLLQFLTSRPVVSDYALASNFDVLLATRGGRSLLFGIGGHHLAWDQRHGYSRFGRHEGARLRPRDGVHLLNASSFRQVLSGAWLPWSQQLPPAAPREPAVALRTRMSARVVDGHHPGCREAFNRYAPLCYFDSKMSLASFRGGYLVYARANTAERGGGRFVQVAASKTGSPAGPYGPFELLHIEGYTAMQQGNVYTAVVRKHPLDESMLLGLFSVNEGQPGKVNRDGKCYIALSLSCDGRHWSHFTPLVYTSGLRGRTFDQPVSGFVRRGPSVHFFLHRDVPQISPAAPTDSRLERYTFRTAALTRLTADVKANCVVSPN